MAVYFNDREEYTGAVLKIGGHQWLDGMYEEWAVVWDKESHTAKNVTFGYYGIDGSNLAGGRAEVDADTETVKDLLRTLKRQAYTDFAKSVTDHKTEIRKGRKVEVVRGRKVRKGTKLDVFWVGERPTYRSRNYSWMNETELIAGGYDESGNKVWIKAEYLKAIDKIASPNAKERKKYIKAYVKRRAEQYDVIV